MTMTFLIVMAAIAAFLTLLVQVSHEGESHPIQRAIGSRHSKVSESRLITDLVRRIFSPEDLDFVSQEGSRRLRRFFEMERRKVALHWVQSISQDAMQIMRFHRLASRRTKQLQPSLEVKLILYYLELRFVCAGLGLLIFIFDPHSLGMVAAHVGQMAQLIDQMLASASTAVRVASPENR